MAGPKKKKGGRKKKSADPLSPSVKVWLVNLGEEILKRRGDGKQESYASDLGLSRAQLGIIERGDRSYGVEVLLKAMRVAGETDPVQWLLRAAPRLGRLSDETASLCAVLIESLHDERRVTALAMIEALRNYKNMVAAEQPPPARPAG